MSRTPFRIFFVERPLRPALPEIAAGLAAAGYRAGARGAAALADGLNRRQADWRLEELPRRLRRDIGLNEAD